MVGGGVSPDHFFYKMTFGECAACLSGIQNREKIEWERTRRMMWSALVPHCKNVKKYSDAMPLAWDNEFQEKQDTEVNEKEIDRIRELAKRIKL